jgi:urease subunit beta
LKLREVKLLIPGEYRIKAGDIELNKGKSTVRIVVVNSGDRPIQVGSHFHFFEVNRALRFDRAQAFGMRLDIASGTAVRFEPGEQKPVQLVELGGAKLSYGLNNLSRGAAQRGELPDDVKSRLQVWETGPVEQAILLAAGADADSPGSSTDISREGGGADGKNGA